MESEDLRPKNRRLNQASVLNNLIVKKRWLWISLMVGFLFLLDVTNVTPVAAHPGPGDYGRSISFDGRTRTFAIHVPPTYVSGSAVPLVLDFHGYTSNSSEQARLSGFREVSDAENFIVAYPQGVGNSWNAATFCCGEALAAKLDDVGLARAIVEAISAEFTIDSERVYATGLSNGGAFSHRLACEASDVFAATAPVAFPLGILPLSACEPSRPITVAHFHGLGDWIVPYAGTFWAPASQTSFASWAEKNQCEGTPVEEGPCETFTQCAGGVETTLCSLNGEHIIYSNDDDFSIARSAWSILSRFTLSEDQSDAATPVAGNSLVIKDKFDATRRKIILSLKDPAIDTSPGSGMNPAISGLKVQFYNAAGGDDVACFDLPAGEAWRQGGSSTGPSYNYRDPQAQFGPCRSVTITDGQQFRMTCAGRRAPIAYSLDEPAQEAVAVRVESAGKAYCAVFGGAISRDLGIDPSTSRGTGLFKAKGAPSPAACPPAPPCP